MIKNKDQSSEKLYRPGAPSWTLLSFMSFGGGVPKSLFTGGLAKKKLVALKKHRNMVEGAGKAPR